MIYAAHGEKKLILFGVNVQSYIADILQRKRMDYVDGKLELSESPDGIAFLTASQVRPKVTISN